MTPEEQNLDMLVAELDRENRLLRARNERLEREAEQRKPLVELTRNERMSYEELEIDRDRMKAARDALLLKNADLNANQRKPWAELDEDVIKALAIKAGFTTTDLMMVGYSVGIFADLIDAALREKNH